MTLDLSREHTRVSIPQLSLRPWGQRLAALSQRWQARRAANAVARQVRAETRDPAVLDELGVAPEKSSHVERWIAAMLAHQH